MAAETMQGIQQLLSALLRDTLTCRTGGGGIGTVDPDTTRVEKAPLHSHRCDYFIHISNTFI